MPDRAEASGPDWQPIGITTKFVGGASANKGWPSIENRYPADFHFTKFGETLKWFKEFRRNKTRAGCVGMGVGGDVTCVVIRLSRLQTKLFWPYTSENKSDGVIEQTN